MPINGKVIPHTPLAVDFWYIRKCPGTRLFFLSHMHSDHTAGLTSTWSNRPIYCSPTTANLLKLKLQVKEQWIHPLELGEPYLLPLDDIGKETLTVTLIDANHCPGSVMFLFEGYFGSILYTGDFRYTPSMLREACLRNNTTIDVLYLDNTNCDPNRTLPSRQRATQEIKEIIRCHPNHNVVIGLYTLGKESLLLELAMEFKTWVEVSCERMEILKALELPDVFTTEPGAGRIQVVEQSEIRPAALHQWNKEHPTLAILPTSRPLISIHPNLHVVPYSDHSSYQELEDFVSALRPTSIVPIVGNYVPGNLSAIVPCKKRHEILVPDSVRQYMLTQPKIQLGSRVQTNLSRRHCQRLTSKGVIFESPVRVTRKPCKQALEEECPEHDASEEDLDQESDKNDPKSILIDLNKGPVPAKQRRVPRGVCSLNIVKTVPEDFTETDALPLGQLSQSNHPMEILTNIKACMKQVTTTRLPFKSKAFETSYCTSQRSRHGNGQSNQTLLHANGLDEDEVIMSDGNSMSKDKEYSRHGIDGDTVMLKISRDNDSCSSSNSLKVLQQEEVERIEESILKELHFSWEDLKSCGILQQDFVKKFSALCPIYDLKKKGLPLT